MALKLEAIQSLAEVERSALPLGDDAIRVGPDGLLIISQPPQLSRLTFFIDELAFHVAVSPDPGGVAGAVGAVCQIWAECGYVPYTAESPMRRYAVLALLRASKDLPRARFVIEPGQKILLVGDSRIPYPSTAEILIYEAVLLIQESRPYLRLLAEQLAQ